MKPTSWLALIVLLPALCQAQSRIDSLKSRLKIEMDSLDTEDVASCFSMIGNEFLAISSYDSALHYYHRSLFFGKGPEVRAATFNSIGIAHNYKGNTDSCIFYYKDALAAYKSIQDTIRTAALEINLSILYKNMGLYDLALENAFSALSKIERNRDRTLASLYNNIASVYRRIGDIQSSLEYFRSSLEIRKEVGFLRGVAQSYTNIGEVFLLTRQYDSALVNLLKAVDIKKADENRNELGSTLGLIGKAYLDMGRYPDAERYLIESRETKRKSGERSQEGSILNSLGKLRIKQGRHDDAKVYLDDAYRLLRETAAMEELRENLELQVMLNKSIGRTGPALKYAEELLMVKDSLLNKDKAESLQTMQLQYETEKKEQQIELLKRDQETRNAELETNQVWIGALTAILLLGLISSVLIISQYRVVITSKKRTELLLQELHHRVKNNLQILSSLFYLPYQNITDKAALEAVKEGEGRVNAMALIHGMLSADIESRTITMQDYLSELVGYLSNSYGFRKLNGQLIVKCGKVQLDVDKAIPVGLIINELVTNAMKYGIPDNKPPVVSVDLKSDGITIALTVSDNGAGFREPFNLNSATSFGLRLVNLLTKELNGNLTMLVDHGTTFRLTFSNS